jgi:hypothetical protein
LAKTQEEEVATTATFRDRPLLNPNSKTQQKKKTTSTKTTTASTTTPAAGKQKKKANWEGPQANEE